MTALVRQCQEVISKRLVYGFDRDLLPNQWVYDDGSSNGPLRDQESKNKQIVGAFISSLYTWNKDVGIRFEGIAAKILGLESRGALYSYLDIDPPLTGIEEIDVGFSDEIPEPNNDFVGLAFASVAAQNQPQPDIIGDDDEASEEKKTENNVDDNDDDRQVEHTNNDDIFNALCNQVLHPDAVSMMDEVE